MCASLILKEEGFAKYQSVKGLLDLINSEKHILLFNDPNNPEKYSDEQLFISSNNLWKYYDRAVSIYSRSYKIWIEYTDERSTYVINQLPNHERAIRTANGTYERALMNLSFCPRLWINYLDFLGRQKRITLLRKTFNRALQSLPITQHDMIWQTYMPIIKETNSIPTVSDAYKRYLMIHPEHVEDAAIWFLNKKANKEAAFYLQKIINDPNFKSTKERPKFYYWTKLAEVINADPSIENAEEMLRSGCEDFIVETGRIWATIADYYARLGRFADAIQVYEDAMLQARTAHDFGYVFNGACTLLQTVMDSSDVFADAFALKLENLLNRHPILLNETMLRQDPNNIECWIKASQYAHGSDFEYEPHRSTFSELLSLFEDRSSSLKLVEAIEKVDPWRAFKGHVSDLWIALSGESQAWDTIIDAAITDEHTTAPDLSRLYIYYAETLIVGGRSDLARNILSRAINDNRTRNAQGMESLWSFALDLEWSFGGVEETRNMFEQCMQSRSVTQRHVIAYTQFLENNGHIDDMFRVFERGINAAGWPANSGLWLRYLTKFVTKYGDTKKERTRDLFEESLKGPKDEASFYLYILYAKFEEDYGLIKHAMEIYRRAADILEDDRIIHIWISSVIKFYGITKAREIYEYAIKRFKGKIAAMWCVRYASVEAKLNEVERARAIFIHGSQLEDPNKVPEFWEAFNQFEIDNGTKETYAEMFSQKNAAIAKFNSTVHVGMINAEGADEETELVEVEAAREIAYQDQKIPRTIFDSGINSKTVLEKFRERRR